MSINHELIPKRRFKEFENADAWEQRKLGDIAISFSGGTPKVGESSFYGGDIPFIRSGEIGSYRTELTLSLEGLNNSSASLVNQGDILYALYGATSGEVEISKINGAINQAILAIKPHDDFDSYTIVQWLKKEKENIISTYLQGGQGNLSGAIIKNLNLVLPSKKEEQELIGKYFKMIDNLITLHQRKLSKLRILKSAYLSEIIPEEGKLNPKRRFPGFTEDWEKKKISDMFKVTRGQVLSMSLTSPIKDETNKYPVYSSQTKNDGLMGYYSEYLFDTAITWTTDGANAGTVNFRKGKFFSTNVNGVLLSNDGYCNKAVSEILNLVTYKYVSKVGNPKLMNNVMEEIIISVPKDKNEMKIISDFLMTFDKRIIYLEEKIKKLEDLKRSYLNEMFV